MKKAIVLIMTLLISQVTLAADLYCTGKIEHIRLNNTEELNVKFDWNADYVTICKFNQTWKSVPASVCARWLPSLQSAEYMQKSINIRYLDPGVTQCSALPVWSLAPGPVYIDLWK